MEPTLKIAIFGNQCAGKTTVKTLLGQHYPMKGSLLPVYDGARYIGRLPISATLKFAEPHYRMLEALGKGKNRQFMQKVSDLAKEVWGPDIFVEIFKERLRRLEGFGYDLIVCDDARYKRELEACKELGFTLLFVDAAEEIRKAHEKEQGLDFISGHNSEAEVESLKEMCDFVVVNEGDLTVLGDSIRKFYSSIIFNA